MLRYKVRSYFAAGLIAGLTNVDCQLHGLCRVRTRACLPKLHDLDTLHVASPVCSSPICVLLPRGQAAPKRIAISLPFDMAQLARVLPRYAVQLTRSVSLMQQSLSN